MPCGRSAGALVDSFYGKMYKQLIGVVVGAMSFSEILGWLWAVASVVIPLSIVVAIVVLVFRGLRGAAVLISSGIASIARALTRFRSRLNRSVTAAVDVIRDVVSGLLLVSVKTYGRVSERVFLASQEAAERAAADRLSFLQREVTTTFPQYKILEIPPGFEDVAPGRMPLDNASAIAQGIDFDMQAGSRELRLYARAADAALCIARRVEATFDIALRELTWGERKSTRFPWVVVIGTNKPEAFKSHLERLREWLGIGVEIAEPLRFRAQRGCRFATERGTIAGGLRTEKPATTYALTCAHVIPPDCNQLRTPFNFATYKAPSGELAPDATLLKLHECISTARERPAVEPVSEGEMLRLKKVFRVGGYSRRCSGSVKYTRVQHTLDGFERKFPACVVEPRKRMWYFWCIPWPVIVRPFSLKTDSGSWVTVEMPGSKNDTRWLGMVAAGDGADTVVILAYALLPFFMNFLNEGDIHAICWED